MLRQSRLNLAMLIAGLGSFSLMYSPQPVLPMLAQDFRLDAATASLAVTLTTGPLAIFILAAGLVSDRLDKPRLMIASIGLAALFTIACGLAPNWPSLLALRIMVGLCIAGVPAVAMTYLTQESGSASLGSAMGLYVAGTAVGGMSGRLGTGLAAELFGWRWGIGLLGLAALILAVAFAFVLPRPLKPIVPRSTPVSGEVARIRRLVADRGLRLLFLQAFLFMGGFVTVYNYAGFRLETSPFDFSPAQIGLIFSLYLLGSVSSAVVGWLSNHYPRPALSALSLTIMAIGALTTLTTSTPVFIVGIGLVTLGFFGAHSLASAWVGVRSAVMGGGAASLYLFAYYLGASVLSTLGGYAWEQAGWTGVIVYVGTLVLIAIGVACALDRCPARVDPTRPSRPS